MSSVSPAFTLELGKELAPTAIRLVDAPVSGTKKPAEDGTLVILASGNTITIQDLPKELAPAAAEPHLDIERFIPLHTPLPEALEQIVETLDIAGLGPVTPGGAGLFSDRSEPPLH